MSRNQTGNPGSVSVVVSGVVGYGCVADVAGARHKILRQVRVWVDPGVDHTDPNSLASVSGLQGAACMNQFQRPAMRRGANGESDVRRVVKRYFFIRLIPFQRLLLQKHFQLLRTDDLKRLVFRRVFVFHNIRFLCLLFLRPAGSGKHTAQNGERQQ